MHRVSSRINRIIQLSFAVFFALALAMTVAAQEGRLIREQVHGKSLEKTVRAAMEQSPLG